MLGETENPKPDLYYGYLSSRLATVRSLPAPHDATPEATMTVKGVEISSTPPLPFLTVQYKSHARESHGAAVPQAIRDGVAIVRANAALFNLANNARA